MWGVTRDRDTCIYEVRGVSRDRDTCKYEVKGVSRDRDTCIYKVRGVCRDRDTCIYEVRGVSRDRDTLGIETPLYRVSRETPLYRVSRETPLYITILWDVSLGTETHTFEVSIYVYLGRDRGLLGLPKDSPREPVTMSRKIRLHFPHNSYVIYHTNITLGVVKQTLPWVWL